MSTNKTPESSSSSPREASFDPRSGFRVNFLLSQQNVSSFHGDYKCLAKILPSATSGGRRSNENVEDFVIYSLIEAPCNTNFFLFYFLNLF
jgi:hypothetical protein